MTNYNYEYIQDQQGIKKVEDWVKDQEYVCFDLETGPSEDYIEEFKENPKIGLDPYRNRIVTYLFGNSKKQWIVDARLDLNYSGLLDIVEREDIPKIGVNLRYDAKVVIQHHDIVPSGLVDCMIMEQVIRCGIFPGSYSGSNEKSSGVVRKYSSMKSLVDRYLRENIDKDHDLRTSLWETPVGSFNERQLRYMAGDVIYPELIAQHQKPLIKERSLSQTIKLENKLIPVLADMEVVGIPFDREYWISLYQESSKNVENLYNKLDKLLGQKVYEQGTLFGEGKKERRYDYASTKQLAHALDDAGFAGFVDSKGEARSTSSDKLTLKKVEGEMPDEVVDTIVEFRKEMKKKSSYGKNFLEEIHPVTERIHPDFTQTCLVTGRISCSPGMQTIPAKSEYRYAFIAPDGWVMIILDASQIEARISGDLTGDQPTIEVFNQGLDIYKEDGEKFYNTEIDKSTEEGQKLRQRAKASWLGLTYGQGKKKFNRYCKLFLGENVSREETDLLWDKFFEVHSQMKEEMDRWSDWAAPFPRRSNWVRDMLADQLIDEEYAYKKMVTNFMKRRYMSRPDSERLAKRLLNEKDIVKYASSKSGRKRFFRVDYLGYWTAARNMPIQSTAADIQKATMLAFQNMHWNQGYDAHVINAIHDEVVTLVREDQAEELYQKQIEIGEKVGQKFLDRVPMKLEGGISDKWEKF